MYTTLIVLESDFLTVKLNPSNFKPYLHIS